MKSELLEEIVRLCAQAILAEEGNLEPYDDETDTFQPSPRDRTEVNGLEETTGEPLVLTDTGMSDDWARPMYRSPKGKLYVDINLGKGEPSIHSTTEEGEPDFPIKNYVIKPAEPNPPIVKVKLTSTGTSDKYDRPVYKDEHGKTYLDVHQGKAKHPLLVGLDAKGNFVGSYLTSRDYTISESKFDVKSLIKECIIDHLKKSLTEGFDPTSAGPNPEATEGSQYNPYPAWNARMQKMEESGDTPMMNTLEVYRETGVKCGEAQRKKDQGMVSHLMNWFQRAVRQEREMSKKLASDAFNKGYREGTGYSQQQKPQYFRESTDSVDAPIPAATEKSQMFPYKDQNDRMRKMEEAAATSLTPKSLATIEKWLALGSREAAKKMIDYILSKKLGLTSDDLADTATFANGLDSIEEALEQKDFVGAYNIAKDTADEMIADEGGDGMDEHNDHGRFAQEAGSGDFDQRDFKVKEGFVFNSNLQKVTRAIFTELTKIGFRTNRKNEARWHVALGKVEDVDIDVGVWCYVNSQNQIQIQSYQEVDNPAHGKVESDYLSDYNFNIPSMPEDEYSSAFVDKIVKLCRYLKDSVKKEFSINEASIDPATATSDYVTSPKGRLYRMTKDEAGNRKTREKGMKRSRGNIRKLGLNVKEENIDEVSMKQVYSVLVAGYVALHSPGKQSLENLLHSPTGRKIVQSVKNEWDSFPQAQKTIDNAEELWSQAMTPTKIEDPNQPLSSEKNMSASDLAQKYADRNADVAQKTSGFVNKYLSGSNLKETSLRKNAIFDKDKPCTHPNGFAHTGKVPLTGPKKCHICGTEDPITKKQIPRLGQF